MPQNSLPLQVIKDYLDRKTQYPPSLNQMCFSEIPDLSFSSIKHLHWLFWEVFVPICTATSGNSEFLLWKAPPAVNAGKSLNLFFLLLPFPYGIAKEKNAEALYVDCTKLSFAWMCVVLRCVPTYFLASQWQTFCTGFLLQSSLLIPGTSNSRIS